MTVSAKMGTLVHPEISEVYEDGKMDIKTEGLAGIPDAGDDQQLTG